MREYSGEPEDKVPSVQVGSTDVHTLCPQLNAKASCTSRRLCFYDILIGIYTYFSNNLKWVLRLNIMQKKEGTKI